MENKVTKVKSQKTLTNNNKSVKRGKVKSKSTSALPSSSSSSSHRSREKKDNYKVISKSSILKDFKNTAINGISSVKQRFNSFSTLLKNHNKSKSDLENYCQIDNMPSPVKMYSPFTIESPAPMKLEDKLKLRQQLFVSPTNRIKQDVAGLESGINELNILSETIENKLKNKNPPVSRSIFDDSLLL